MSPKPSEFQKEETSSKDSRQNPENKIEDEKRSQFSKTDGKKVDHSTMSQSSKADLIQKRNVHRPRDQA